MAKVITDNQHYADIASAIRTKNETDTLYKPSEMAPAILAIQGGVELNFEVVGGTTQPENPKENTIWVNTPNEITGWVFDSVEPASPVQGMIWIETTANNDLGFNALKEDGLYVYPLRTQLYTEDGWEPTSPQIYQNGEWVSWIRYLFSENADTAFSVVIKTSSDVSPTISDGKMTFEASDSDNNWSYMCALRYADAVDLTNYRTMLVDIDSISVSGGGVHFFVAITTEKFDVHNDDANVVFTLAGATRLAKNAILKNESFLVDISSFGAGCYIYIGVLSGTTYLPASSSAFSNSNNGSITAVVSSVGVY